MAYFAGIDGGGSKTRCIVADEARILGRSDAASSKLSRVGEQEAREALLGALREACRPAAISVNQLDSVCIGIAGAGCSEVAHAVEQLLTAKVPGKVEVVGDMVIALEAALGDGPGLIAIAGTGSIVYGRNRGETARAGGWGPEVSDEGSGTWIGKRAVATTLRAHDAGKQLPLLAGILSMWKLFSVDELVSLLNRGTCPDYARLFPVVNALANEREESARGILREAAQELSELALVVLRRLWSDAEEASVHMTGGVFANSELIRQSFDNALRSARPATRISDVIVEPVQGALSRARKALFMAAKKG